MSVVPPRSDGFQVNPVPCEVTSVIVPCGMANDCPPGITPRKLGVLLIVFKREKKQIRQNLERTKEKGEKNIPLHQIFIPPQPSIRALHDLIRRFDREVKIR